MFTRARLFCAGLLVALTAGVLVAAPMTVGVVGEHAAHHTGTGTDPD
jgi:hypothetical protein